MITRTKTDFVNICYDAEKIAKSAHAAYWLSCCGEDALDRLRIQETDIVESFKKIAGLLGYRVEKIAPEEPVPANLEAAE